jgi:arylsulfatase A-like enzyme
MTPFRQHKGWLAEGGIHCPLVVAGAGVRRAAGSIHDGLVHVMDIAPTLLELAGVTPPAEHQGRQPGSRSDPGHPARFRSWPRTTGMVKKTPPSRASAGRQARRPGRVPGRANHPVARLFRSM